jgi:hypothetical protein
MNQQEKRLQKAVAQYIKMQYPDVMFISEQSGLKVSIGVAKYLKATRSPERGLPDMVILYPAKGFHGLCLELKTDYEEVYTQMGNMRNEKHVREQAQVLFRLNNLGYKALFVFGFDEAKKLIDLYLTA